MSEQAEVLDGKVAYQVAMKNLEATRSYPWPLPTEYPDRYFYYGEEGRGLILSHGLVYVSSTEAEDVRAVDGPIKIGTHLYLENPKFRSLHGELPQLAIGDIIDLTAQVKATIEAHRNQVSQK